MKKYYLCILIIAGLYSNELDYNYIEDDIYNEVNTKQSKQLKSNNRQRNKQLRATTKNNKNGSKKLLEDRKEASGVILGAGMTSAIVVPPTSSIVGNAGFNFLVGYKWFHTPGFGQRLYADYTAGVIRLMESNVDGTIPYSESKTHDLALNYDLLFNWVKTRGFKFGMLLGLNTGLHIAQSGLFAFGGNLGFRFGIFKNHSIETFGQAKLLFDSSNTYCDPYAYGSCSPAIGVSIKGILRYVYTF